MLRIIDATMGTAGDAPRTIALLLVLGFPMVAAAHGGGLDAAGCHNDNKHGGYHCHRGPLAGRSFNSKAEALDAMAPVHYWGTIHGSVAGGAWPHITSWPRSRLCAAR